MRFNIEDFVRESNRIEGILRAPTPLELQAHDVLMRQERLTVQDLCHFVADCQHGAVLREKHGLDVRVGPHIPPPGSPEIRTQLEQFLAGIGKTNWTPWRAHCFYETLHPFTDGNGRSGRALWLWMMGGIEGAPLGFLHHFYYQTLQETRPAKP